MNLANLTTQKNEETEKKLESKKTDKNLEVSEIQLESKKTEKKLEPKKNLLFSNLLEKKYFVGIIILLAILIICFFLLVFKGDFFKKDIQNADLGSQNSSSSFVEIAVQFYENKTYNLSFLHPNTWKVVEAQNNSSQIDENINVAVRILPQIDNNNEQKSFDPNLVILVNKKPEIQNLSQAVDAELENFSKSSGISDYKTISKEKTALDNSLAIKVIQTASVESTKIQQLQYFIFKNEILYIVTYTSQPESFEKNLQGAQEIIKSLKLG